MRNMGLTTALLALAACSGSPDKDDTDVSGDTDVSADTDVAEDTDVAVECETPVDHPHDPSTAEWTYHGADDGPDKWGDLDGYALCGSGMEQTPIDIVDASASASAEGLTFANYDLALPIDLLNNGHTLQVNYTTSQSASDPQITYAGKTYYLVQFHVHSTSEHTIDGTSYPFEVHFVHKASDNSLAVVGVMLDDGAENAVISQLLDEDPGHESETTCADTVMPSAIVPTGSGFYHYGGSLTTPPCTEGVQWFVLKEHGTASAEQATEWQAEFGGTTNRPVQDLDGRTVDSTN